jgi:hypothetical protein
VSSPVKSNSYETHPVPKSHVYFTENTVSSEDAIDPSGGDFVLIDVHSLSVPNQVCEVCCIGMSKREEVSEGKSYLSDVVWALLHMTT